jgi:hypothetical protein
VIAKRDSAKPWPNLNCCKISLKIHNQIPVRIRSVEPCRRCPQQSVQATSHLGHHYISHCSAVKRARPLAGKSLLEHLPPSHFEIFQLRIIPPNRPHPAHEFTLSESPQFVSYLLIKPPKSLTNKDFTGKSLFLKDLEKINR